MAGGSIPWRRHVLVAAVVRELERDAEILVPHQRDDLLQVVPVLPGDADLVLLDGRLHLDLRILDEPDDLPGALDRDPLLQRDLLPKHAAPALLDLAVGERLQGHAALVQARLEDVDHRLQLHVVGGGDGDVGLLELDVALRALEVVARRDFPAGLIEPVGDLLHIDLARDVERILGGHGPSYFRGAPRPAGPQPPDRPRRALLQRRTPARGAPPPPPPAARPPSKAPP